ncbi:MAG: hypothetical protein Ct9H90mP20_4950 [Candidatus Neomarinimicrobiota bacterium]|nr:MAG: hypothetical protein Ct9H90mP20_4950 [Candidatus Neomarinimicrobiota bacterium]
MIGMIFDQENNMRINKLKMAGVFHPRGLSMLGFQQVLDFLAKSNLQKENGIETVNEDTLDLNERIEEQIYPAYLIGPNQASQIKESIKPVGYDCII